MGISKDRMILCEIKDVIKGYNLKDDLQQKEILAEINGYVKTYFEKAPDLRSPNRNGPRTLSTNPEFQKDLATLSNRKLSVKYGVTVPAIFYHKKKIRDQEEDDSRCVKLLGDLQKIGL